jgi:predicted deacylase
VFHGGDGPKVAVLAGVHGNELEGLYVCHRLAAWLEDLASSHPEAFLGQVELVPAMNPLGLDTLQRLVPVYETDLNRSRGTSSPASRPEKADRTRSTHNSCHHRLHESSTISALASGQRSPSPSTPPDGSAMRWIIFPASSRGTGLVPMGS